MQLVSGLAISGSIFIGQARIWHQHKFTDFPITIEPAQIDAELARLHTGIRQLEANLQKQTAAPETSQLDKDLLNTHLMIATDIEIAVMLEEAIRKNLASAPRAVQTSFEKVIQSFERMDNDFFAQRADDYKDVARQLMAVLLGEKDGKRERYSPEDIVFLPEITPSLVSSLAKSGAKAYCVEHGSYTSHSSILSRALGLTALVARKETISLLKNKDAVILDAIEGKIILKPEEDVIERYQATQSDFLKQEKMLQRYLAEPAVTGNKVKISIYANLEYPDEIKSVQANYCDGIGLFRTEFLYLNRSNLPDEDEQAGIYGKMLSEMNGKPVIIRTFDLGGDKILSLPEYHPEENPYLGNRGIRFSLEQQDLFKTQIRAILRASVIGSTAIMFPMIICAEDFISAKKVVRECQEELNTKGVPFDQNIKIGAMIETPSAAICARQLAKICDFLSLGTNDLVQYTLAVDRNNEKVAAYYVQHHPSVLKLIKLTVTEGKRAGIPVSICGEMASESMYVPLLVGLGIEQFSIQPLKAAEVKSIIRQCDQQLFDIVKDFDFDTDLSNIEHLIYHTLKPYYTIQVQ